MQRRAIILSQQCGDRAMSIRYILSDRLLFGNFKQSFILAALLAIYCLNFLFGKKCTYIISYLKQKETIIL
jgi:hypothetical protein